MVVDILETCEPTLDRRRPTFQNAVLSTTTACLLTFRPLRKLLNDQALTGWEG